MTTEEILALNFAALLIGSDDPEYVCSIIDQLPKDNYTERAFDKLMDGPFGKVVIETPCGCEAVTGYKTAIAEAILSVQRRGYDFRSQEAKMAVVQDRERIVDQLEAMLRSVLSDNQQTLQ